MIDPRDVRNERETSNSDRRGLDALSPMSTSVWQGECVFTATSSSGAVVEDTLVPKSFMSSPCDVPCRCASRFGIQATSPLDAHPRTCLSRQPRPQCAVRAANLRVTATLRSSLNVILRQRAVGAKKKKPVPGRIRFRKNHITSNTKMLFSGSLLSLLVGPQSNWPQHTDRTQPFQKWCQVHIGKIEGEATRHRCDGCKWSVAHTRISGCSAWSCICAAQADVCRRYHSKSVVGRQRALC